MSADGSEARFQAFVDAEITCRHLEEAVAELHARLHDKSQEDALKLLQHHVAAAKAEREQATAQFPPAQRARCRAEAQLQQNSKEMEQLQASIVQEEKDILGLRRSLEKLRHQVEAKHGEIKEHRERVELLREEEVLLLHEMEACRQRTEAEHALQETLAQQVADERTKRMELKAACRHKIKKVEDTQNFLQGRAEAFEAEISAVREELKGQETSTAALLAELSETKAEADLAACEAADAFQQQQQIASERSEVQLQHGELLEQLTDCKQMLEAKTKEDSASLAKWRLQYMSKLDAKIQARREWKKRHAAGRTAPKMILEPVTLEPVTQKVEP
ncbi:hypothetical protein AK812_SmicGene19701 [Symbiodinium microadriaticum]|uniref:Uncharacterized protein n=1 Tax=Symbiodinium microadriaticum TaxID=2951 RepID=A0A1Q9DS02_SYMMI|nr:hypothetical protein AK812_SmicGene19701 [Symbiodinium microadriaticum]CAE7271277.1 unnamed protein product [Symbiodinium microadriaticum]